MTAPDFREEARAVALKCHADAADPDDPLVLCESCAAALAVAAYERGVEAAAIKAESCGLCDDMCLDLIAMKIRALSAPKGAK